LGQFYHLPSARRPKLGSRRQGSLKGNVMPQCHVELYALSTCSHCRDTKDLLNQCGINYDCVDVDQLEPEKRRTVLEKIKKLNPQCTFPTLVAGDKVIIGFKEAEIKEALGIS
jgi:glutaredoxin-like protein NrdH